MNGRRNEFKGTWVLRTNGKISYFRSEGYAGISVSGFFNDNEQENSVDWNEEITSRDYYVGDDYATIYQDSVLDGWW